MVQLTSAVLVAGAAFAGQALAITQCVPGQFYCGYNLLNSRKPPPHPVPLENDINEIKKKYSIGNRSMEDQDRRGPRGTRPPRRRRAREQLALLVPHRRHHRAGRVLLRGRQPAVPLPASFCEWMWRREHEQ